MDSKYLVGKVGPPKYPLNIYNCVIYLLELLNRYMNPECMKRDLEYLPTEQKSKDLLAYLSKDYSSYATCGSKTSSRTS